MACKEALSINDYDRPLCVDVLGDLECDERDKALAAHAALVAQFFMAKIRKYSFTHRSGVYNGFKVRLITIQ